jgi:hypothetical protein
LLAEYSFRQYQQQLMDKYSFLFGDKVKKSAKLVKATIQRFIGNTREELSMVSTDPEKSSQGNKYNVLKEMSSSWPTEDGRVSSEATLLLIGGRDTTAATISNLFFYLARQPETYEKLRKQCMDAPADITYDQLRDLKYLNDCIRESEYKNASAMSITSCLRLSLGWTVMLTGLARSSYGKPDRRSHPYKQHRHDSADGRRP